MSQKNSNSHIQDYEPVLNSVSLLTKSKSMLKMSRSIKQNCMNSQHRPIQRQKIILTQLLNNPSQKHIQIYKIPQIIAQKQGKKAQQAKKQQSKTKTNIQSKDKDNDKETIKIASYANYTKFVEQKNMKITVLQNKVSYLEQQILLIKKQQKQKLDSSNNQHERKCRDLYERIDILEKQKDNISKRAKGYLKQNEQLTIKIFNMKQEYQAREEKLIISMKTQLNFLQEQNKVYREADAQRMVALQKQKSLEKNYNEYMFKYNTIQSELNSLQIKMYKNNQETAQLVNNNKQLQISNSKLLSIIRQNEQKIQYLSKKQLNAIKEKQHETQKEQNQIEQNSQIQKAYSYTKTLQQKCRQLCKQNKRLTQNYQQYNKQLTDLLNNIEQYKQKMRYLQKERDQKTVSIAQLTKNLQMYKNQIIETKNKLNIAQNKQQQHKIQENVKNQQIKALKQKINSKNLQLENSTKQLEITKQEQKQRTKTHNQQMTKLKEQLTQSCIKLNEQITKTNKLNSIYQQLCSQKQKLEQISKKYVQDIQRIQSITKQLKQQLNKSILQCQKSKKQLQKYKEQTRQQQIKEEEMKNNKLDELQAQIKKKIQIISDGNKHIIQLNDKIRELEAENQNISKKCKQKINMVNTQNIINNKKLHDKLDNYRLLQQQLQAQKTQLQIRIHQKQRIITQLTNIMQKNQIQYLRASQQLQKQTQTVNKLKQYNITVNGQFEQLTQKYRQKLREVQQYTKMVRQMRECILELEERLKKQNRDFRELQNSLYMSNKKQKQQSVKDIQHLYKGKISEYEQSIKFLSEQLKIWAEKYERVNQQNQILIEKISQILDKQKQKEKSQQRSTATNSKNISAVQTPKKKKKQKEIKQLQRELQSSKFLITTLKQQNKSLQNTLNNELQKRKQIIQSLIRQKNILYESLSTNLRK